MCSSVSSIILSVSVGYLNSTKTFFVFHMNEFSARFQAAFYKLIYRQMASSIYAVKFFTRTQNWLVAHTVVLSSFMSLLSIKIKFKSCISCFNVMQNSSRPECRVWGLQLQRNSDFLKVDRPVYIADTTHADRLIAHASPANGQGCCGVG